MTPINFSKTTNIQNTEKPKEPSQKILSLLNGPERQYIALAGAGKSIMYIAHTMNLHSDNVLELRASSALKILNALTPTKLN